MTLTFCRDLSAADWIAHSDLPWDQLVCFGPAGFDSYARLRFLPDPERPGQSESDADPDGRRPDQLPSLLEVLATHTATPDDCYFGVWEGFGDFRSALEARVDHLEAHVEYVDADSAVAEPEWTPARPGLAPEPDAPPWVRQLPKVVVPNRAYFLFRGPLADVGTWDTAQEWPSQFRFNISQPAFVWPADHAWCVAWDVDPHWAGIGGTTSLITRLTTDPRLDVVLADPTEDQPAYL